MMSWHWWRQGTTAPHQRRYERSSQANAACRSGQSCQRGSWLLLHKAALFTRKGNAEENELCCTSYLPTSDCTRIGEVADFASQMVPSTKPDCSAGEISPLSWWFPANSTFQPCFLSAQSAEPGANTKKCLSLKRGSACGSHQDGQDFKLNGA